MCHVFAIGKFFACGGFYRAAVKIFVQILYAAELGNERKGALFTYAVYARHIVRAIAHKPLYIYKFRRCHAVFFLDCGGVKLRCFRLAHSCDGKHDFCGVRCKLKIIFISRDDAAFHSAFVADSAHRAYYVVRLVTFFFEYGYIHGVQNLFEHRHLHCKLRRHLFALCLVEGIFYVTECRRLKVECHGDVIRV